MHHRDPVVARRRLVGSHDDQLLGGPGRRRRARLRSGLVAAAAASVLLGFGAAPALAWDARSTEGTAAERRNTTTPLPPGGDQCSLGAPDYVWSLYDFSWACYAHDVCYQNHQLNGRTRSRLDCDNIMLAKMVAECDSRHGRWNPKRYVCRDAATKYWGAVRAVGQPSWNSWNGVPE
ncbi:MAG: phospholipase A2 [Solirubrobacteraceae bacterium]